MPVTSKSARLLANPGGGRGRVRRHLDRLARCCQRHGIALELSESPADLARRAAAAASSGLERLVVAGGDGTVHWAVQGLAGSATALAALKLGSGNDFASVLGTPADLDEAVAWALEAPRREVDLLRAGNGEGGRWVAGVAYVGFDSEVNRAANRMRGAPFGWLGRGPLLYVLAILRVLPSFQPVRMRVEVESDAAAFDGPAMFAAVANAPRYGGGMRIAPAARLDDGCLDVVVLSRVGKGELLRVFPRVFSGRHVEHPAVRTLRSRWARVTLDRPLVAHGDGEPIGPLGAPGMRFEARPGALHVVSELR